MLMQSLLQWKTLLAYVLAAGSGLYAYFAYPFPTRNLILALIPIHRPDRIIVGEILGGEAYDLLQAFEK